MSGPDQNLSEWLRIATDTLTPPAKERIGSEIRAHYAEAVQEHIEDGYYESFAKKAALRELGEAEIAAKRFRNQHLTEKETEIIGELLKTAHDPQWILLGAVGFAVLMCFYHFTKSSRQPGDQILFGLAVGSLVYPAVYYLVAKFSSARHVVKLLLPIEWTAYFGMLILSISCGRPFFSVFFTGSVIKAIPRLRLWLKLRNIDDISSEMPRRGTVAS